MNEILRETILAAGTVAALASLPGASELLLVTTGAIRRRPFKSATLPVNFSLAAVVPAHNEELLIASCVSSLMDSAAEGPKCSIIVVADNCTDSTALRAREAGARVLVRQNADQRGKGHALRFAFECLMDEGFDGFVVVDADSTVSGNLLSEIAKGLFNGADAIQTRYRVSKPLTSNRTKLMDVALLAFNVLRPRGRDGWGLSAGILGNGFALSRQTLLDVPYSAESIVEDLEYHLLLVQARKKVRFADAATVYGDMPEGDAAQSSQRARWEGGRVQIAKMWIPRLCADFFRARLWATEPLMELLTLPLAFLALLSLLLCAIPIGALRGYGCFLMLLVLTHVGSAIALGGDTKQSLAALASAPKYVFWKLTKIGTIIRSSRVNTKWLRTPRSGDSAPEAPHVR